MDTTDKIINDLAIQLANKTIECANYKALYEEAQTQLQQLQAEKTEKEEAQTQLQQLQAEKTEKEEA